MSKPMQEPTFLVLTALVEGSQHGYGLLSRVEQLTGGRVRLRVGTLYAVLERLAAEGRLEVEAEQVVDGRLRRTYRLTDSGAEALRVEADRLAGLAHEARTRLALRPASIQGLPA